MEVTVENLLTKIGELTMQVQLLQDQLAEANAQIAQQKHQSLANEQLGRPSKKTA